MWKETVLKIKTEIDNNMEVNQIGNREITMNLLNAAVGILMENNIITQEDIRELKFNVGYIFTTKDQKLEGLFKISFPDNTYYFAVQNGKLLMITINAAMYEQTINYMKDNHPCIMNDELPETEVQKKRREKNNKIISKEMISTYDKLMTRWKDDEVTLKDKETVCKRAVTCFFVIQIACDINKGNYEESLDYFKPMLEKFDLIDQLNSKEKRIIDGTYSHQDAVDMDWAYEAYWSLCWCLGLVEDISDVGNICDCQKAIQFVMSCKTIEEFMTKCNLRDKEEILDMLDLYFRYNWAINESKVNPEATIGDINPSVVVERRRGLEWIVSDEEDWYDFMMNA